MSCYPSCCTERIRAGSGQHTDTAAGALCRCESASVDLPLPGPSLAWTARDPRLVDSYCERDCKAQLKCFESISNQSWAMQTTTFKHLDCVLTGNSTEPRKVRAPGYAATSSDCCSVAELYRSLRDRHSSVSSCQVVSDRVLLNLTVCFAR